VLVLVGAVLSISVPSYRNYTTNQRALSTARTLASDLRVAQQEAVTRRADISVTFAGADPNCGSRASYTLGQGGVVFKRNCFPIYVEWATLPATLTWDPTGIAAAGGTLTIRSTLTLKAYNVCVAAQTGAITDDTGRLGTCG